LKLTGAIEAAQLACGIAAGNLRRFAFERIHMAARQRPEHAPTQARTHFGIAMRAGMASSPAGCCHQR